MGYITKVKLLIPPVVSHSRESQPKEKQKIKTFSCERAHVSKATLGRVIDLFSK